MNTKLLRPGLAFGLLIGSLLILSSWFMGDFIEQFNSTTNLLLLLVGSVYSVGLVRFIKPRREKLFSGLKTPQKPAKTQQGNSLFEMQSV